MSYQLFFKLAEDGKTPIPCYDPIEWATWFGETDTTVELTTFGLEGEIIASTVFLGINHALFDKEPILFETMVTGGEFNKFTARYHTWSEAVKGHSEIVARIHKSLLKLG